MKTYFGFAIADGMFPENTTIVRSKWDVEDVKAAIAGGGVTPCLNPSHKPTINAMRSRFGIDIAIPEVAPNIKLDLGDSMIVMAVQGLPRLGADRHEYTPEEIAGATFRFGEYRVG